MARRYEFDEGGTSLVVDHDRWLLTGDTVWNRHGPMVRATWELLGGYPEFDAHLDMQITLAVPAAYSVSLRLEQDQPAVRLCARGVHTNPGAQQMRGVTHLHDVREGGRAGVSIELPVPPFGRAVQTHVVTGGEYRENFSAFCRFLGIDVRSFRWEHPTVDGEAVTPVQEG
jgi:hypothetical protein